MTYVSPFRKLNSLSKSPFNLRIDDYVYLKIDGRSTTNLVGTIVHINARVFSDDILVTIKLDDGRYTQAPGEIVWLLSPLPK